MNQQTIHMKCQYLFTLKKKKYFKMSSAAVVIGALMWLFSHVASQFLSCLNIITWLSILFTLQSRELPVNSNVYFSQGLSF